MNQTLNDLLMFLDAGNAGRYDLDQAADGLRRWLIELEGASGRLQVVIVGEFNSGKSTLVNAMLGRKVAFTDAFVATTGNTTYVGSHDEGATVRFGGRTELWTLDEYLARCTERSLGDVEDIEVRISHPFPFDVTDTPGMASIHEQDDIRADQAVRRADVLVWVVDPTDLLSAKEGAFLARAKAIGIPILLVISKSDLLAEDEIEISVQCLMDRLGYGSGQIIPLSAETHLEIRSDVGMNRLVDRLVAMGRDASSVQSSARQAKLVEVTDEMRRVVKLLRARNEEEMRWVENERGLIRRQADVVREKLSDSLQRNVHGSLLRHLQATIPADVHPEDVHRLAQGALQSYVDCVLPAVSGQLREQARAESRAVWDESFETRAQDLKHQIEALMSRGLEHQGTVEFLQLQLREAVGRQDAVRRAVEQVEQSIRPQDDSSRVAMNSVALGLVGAVLTASALPLLIGGVVAAYVVNQPQRQGPQVSPSRQASTLVRDETLSAFASQVAVNVREHLRDPLDRYVELIEDEALSSLTARHFDGQTPADIEASSGRILDFAKALGI